MMLLTNPHAIHIDGMEVGVENIVLVGRGWNLISSEASCIQLYIDLLMPHRSKVQLEIYGFYTTMLSHPNN